MAGFIYISRLRWKFGATTALRMSDGFEKMHFAVLAVVLYIICFFFLAQVLKLMPVSVSYAIWGGVGTVAISIIGVYYFGESMNWLRAGFITMIIIGAVGLNMTAEPRDIEAEKMKINEKNI